MVVRRSSSRLLWLLGVVLSITGVLFLIANLKNTELGAEGSDWSGVFQDIYLLLMSLVLAMAAVVFIYTIYRYFKFASWKKGRVDVRPARMNYLGILVFVLVIGAVMLSSANLGIYLDEGSSEGTNDPPSEGSSDEDLGSKRGGSMLLTILFLGVAMAIPLFLFIYGKSLFSHHTTFEQGDRTREVLGEVIKRIQRRTGDDLRDAIIQSYAEMVELVQGRIVGQDLMTPQEFARIAINDLGWPSGPVQQLTSIFEEARYSHHELTEIHRDRALSGLEEIRSIIEPGDGPTAEASTSTN